MKLALPLAALVFVLASTLDEPEAAACSQAVPAPGWEVTDSLALANGLPTDAPIPLGLFFVRDYVGGPGEGARGKVQVDVTTLDGAKVEGTFEPNDAEQSIYAIDSFFRPAASLAPSTRYRITTTIEEGTVLRGAATRSFELTTTAGPVRLALPGNIAATAAMDWSRTGGSTYACCDGATPRDVDSCGRTHVGHCFSTSGEPQVREHVSWTGLAASDMPFLAFALVAPDGTRANLGLGATTGDLRFRQEAGRYCGSLEVTNRTRPDGASVKSTPICVDHGDLPSFADFVPSFPDEEAQCKGAIHRYDTKGEPTGELYVPGKASSLDADGGGCTAGARAPGPELALFTVAVVVLSARGRRTRRSSTCS